MDTKLLKYENQLPDDIILLEKEYSGRKNMIHKCIVCNHEFKITANKMLKLNQCPEQDQHPIVSNYIDVKEVEPVSLPASVLFKPELTIYEYKKALPIRKKIVGNLTDINKPTQHKCSWCKLISCEIPLSFYKRGFICKKCGKA